MYIIINIDPKQTIDHVGTEVKRAANSEQPLIWADLTFSGKVPDFKIVVI